MPVKPQQRTLNTLRTILMANKHEGKIPSLNAVNTIFINLLTQQVGDEAWDLFHKVGSLPLMTTYLEVSCIAEGCPCEHRVKKNHCWHGQVEKATTVQLAPADHNGLDESRKLNGPKVAGWWKEQFAQALNAKVAV